MYLTYEIPAAYIEYNSCADSCIYRVPFTLFDIHCSRLRGILKLEGSQPHPHSGQGTGEDRGK